VDREPKRLRPYLKLSGYNGCAMRIHRFAALYLVLAGAFAAAEVRLPNVFSDHAVVQRGQPVRIWGWAAPAEKVQVSFHAQKLIATADQDGAWEIWLRPEQAGGPYTLHVEGDQSAAPLERADILVGDVWLASGQSNMEMPLAGWGPLQIKDAAKEIAAANRPRIRLLVQTKRTSAVPVDDTADTWKICTPDTVKEFSAVAYLFGRRIAEEQNVPVGLIDTTWGGSPAHAWISAEGLAWANLPSVVYDGGALVRKQGYMDAVKENKQAQIAAAKAAGRPEPKFQDKTMWPRGDHNGSWTPSTLFNGMIAPFTRYSIKGVIWYQGETDNEGMKALNYSRVFPALIEDWRKQWAEGPLPFLYVQISSYDGGPAWSTVRDAQRRALQLEKTGMVVTLDLGSAKNVHPPDKQTVAARLDAAAQQIAYGQNIEGVSPLLVEVTTEGGAIRAWLSHADGLHSADASPGDFEVAGDDGKWAAATAKIEAVDGWTTVVASSPDVPAPKQIRYGWNAVVSSFLYNSAGLPMGTFTSESDARMMVP